MNGSGPGYTKDIQKWPIPKISKDVERFLGFANYHRAFIKDYSKIAIPLQDLTGKRSFHWDLQQQQAFDQLRQSLVMAPVLALPNSTNPFILDTYVSDKVIAAELLQVQGDKRGP